MSKKARLDPRMRSWPPLILWALLWPDLSFAVPPVDVSLPDVSPLKREPLSESLFFNDTPRSRATSGNILIGRIFFSPAERRHRRAEKTPARDAPTTAYAPRVGRLVVNGAVNSSAQGRAVWVNGAAIENSASAWTDRLGRVWLRDDKKTPRSVRPGQTIDLASGAIEDLLPAGSVVRH